MIFGGSSVKKEPWETWFIPVKFIDIPDSDVDREAMEDRFEDSILKLVELLLEGNDVMPNMYEGMKCFPFDIDFKKNQSASGRPSLFGIFRKLTN